MNAKIRCVGKATFHRDLSHLSLSQDDINTSITQSTVATSTSTSPSPPKCNNENTARSSDEPAVEPSSRVLGIFLEVRAVHYRALGHVKDGFADTEELFSDGADGGVGEGGRIGSDRVKRSRLDVKVKVRGEREREREMLT